VVHAAWAGFKLTRYLMGFTGEARYGDWVETLLYNGIGATLPVQPDGRSYYYADYRVGMGAKTFFWRWNGRMQVKRCVCGRRPRFLSRTRLLCT